MSLVSTQNNGKFQYFIRNDYGLLVQKVKQFASSPEPGVIISPPFNGTVYRIEQLIQDDASKFAHPLVQIDLGANIEDIAGVEAYIRSQGYSTEQKLILLITNCDYCLKSKGAHLLRTIAKRHYEGRWKVICLKVILLLKPIGIYLGQLTSMHKNITTLFLTLSKLQDLCTT